MKKWVFVGCMVLSCGMLMTSKIIEWYDWRKMKKEILKHDAKLTEIDVELKVLEREVNKMMAEMEIDQDTETI